MPTKHQQRRPTWPTCTVGPAHPHTVMVPQVVARLEAVLSQKRFTQLGGLQLEKDVRLLVSEWDWVCVLNWVDQTGGRAGRQAGGARRSSQSLQACRGKGPVSGLPPGCSRHCYIHLCLQVGYRR